MPLHPAAAAHLALALSTVTLLPGCGGEDAAERDAGPTEDAVQASRERFEASEEFRSEAGGVDSASAAAVVPTPAPAVQEPTQESDTAAAPAGHPGALNRQAEDLLGEIDAAIEEQRYPQARAALDTLKSMAEANPDAEPGFGARIDAVQASLETAEQGNADPGAVRGAIEAAKADAMEAPAPETRPVEYGNAPANDSPTFEK